MKKLLILLSTILISLSLCACSSKQKDEQISKLFEDGYVYSSMQISGENEFKCLLIKDDKEFVVVFANLTSKQYEEYGNLDVFSDTYDQDVIDYICSLSASEIREIKDIVPSQEELDKFVGLTIGELEDMGFIQNGYIETDNKQFNFFYDNNQYQITVHMQDGVTIENMDDYSNNDIRALVIGSISDPTVSWYLLDSITQ